MICVQPQSGQDGHDAQRHVERVLCQEQEDFIIGSLSIICIQWYIIISFKRIVLFIN